MEEHVKTSFMVLVLFFLFFSRLAPAAQPTSLHDYRVAEGLLASGKYSEAIALYRKALNAPPTGVSAGTLHCRIGDAYFRLGDFRGALASYRNALGDPNLPDRPQTQYWVGFCCFLLGRDAEAVAELLKVPALYPHAAAWGATSYYWAGRASERMGKSEQAAEYYRKAGGSGRSTQGRFAFKKAEAVQQTGAKPQEPDNQ
jgi:tetratricopeptide (TPR) repeat protein